MKINSVSFLTLTLCFMALGLNAQDEKKPLKVISYNIWNGFDFRKDVERKNNVIDWFAYQKPDVVALQELCGYNEETLLEDAKNGGTTMQLFLKTTAIR
jgi:endonuclease/exonuclease/phosphatase family metal-dependent hydrolase